MTLPAALVELTDPAQATPRLQAAGYTITRAEPAYVRHKAGETTMVAYRLTLPDETACWAYAHWCHDPIRAGQIHHKASTLRPRSSSAGPGLCRLDSQTVLYAFPNDACLRRLRWYIDPRKVKRSLEPLTCPSERISGSRTRVEVLRYKPERRVVARVDLASTAGTRPLFLRYSTRRQAHHLAQVAAHLRSHGIDTPAPIAQLDDDQVTVDQFLDGTPLLDATQAGHVDSASLAAAITHLHDTPAPNSMPQRTAAGDLSRTLHGIGGLAAWHPTLREPARAVAAMLERQLPTTAGPAVLLHGDLHANNILVRDGSVIFIDLERVATGPAAIDLGFLTAHAIALGIRRHGWSPTAVAITNEVTDAHQTLSRPIPAGELAWHTALGLVEQAVLVVRYLESGWQQTSVDLLDTARRQLAYRSLSGATTR